MNALPTAVFLDRDGTVIEDAHYLSDPAKVRLKEGAADAIARLNAALVPVIVITNQSGIGRGFFTVAEFNAVSRKIDELLLERGAHIDATYYCPHGPGDGCGCRKPGLKLFLDAASDHVAVNLSRAVYVGDRRRDIEPGLTLGGSAVLVPSPETPDEDVKYAEAMARVAPSLGAVVDWYVCTN